MSGHSFTASEEVTAGQLNSINGHVVTTGAVNVMAITMPFTLAAYFDGFSVTIEPNETNTAAATLNVDTEGATNIVRQDGADLLPGDLQAGLKYTLVYDLTNTRFLLMGTGINIQQSFFQTQKLPSNSTVNLDHLLSCSNDDGSIIISIFNEINVGAVMTNRIARYELEPISGKYFLTHIVAGQTVSNNGANGSYPVVLGSFVYQVYESSAGVVSMYRYDLADLTNAVSITISGGSLAAGNNYNIAFTDGTDLYIEQNASGNGVFEYFSVSGTTITSQGTRTFDTDLINGDNTVVFADDTNVWAWNSDDKAMRMYTIADGNLDATETFGILGEGTYYYQQDNATNNANNVMGMMKIPGRTNLVYLSQFIKEWAEYDSGSNADVFSYIVIFPFKRISV